MISSLDILKASILVVDDQDANVSLLVQVLRGAGYVSISSTSDPRAVCELHRKNRYSLILLDLQMPGFNGFEVMEGLKPIEMDGYLPVLVITAQPDHKLRALKAGAKDFISKPFELAEVLARVRNLLEVRLLHLESKRLYEKVVAEQIVSAELLRIFRAGPVAVSINTVAEGRIIDVNEEYCRFLGYSREEILDRSVKDVNAWANPEDRALVMARLLVERSMRGFEAKLCRKGGEVRDVLASFELIELAGEIEPVLICMFIDITVQKEAELKLRESEEKYRDLFENANDLILSVAPDGRLLYANRAWEEALNYGADDLATLKLPDLVHLDHREQFGIFFTAATEGMKVQLVEAEFVSKSGKRIAVEGSVSAKSVNGQVVSLRCIFRDVTEKKKLEAQSLRNQRMESLGTLAGGIAHDLNNALSPILLSIELLRKKSVDPGSIRILDILATSTQRGADMVKQVLTFSRGVEGKRAQVPIKHLIKEMEMIIHQTFPKSVQLRTEVPTEVWPLIGDATQLYQVLLNLCVNARDAMPNGGMLTIKVGDVLLDEHFARMHLEAKPGPYVELSVIDTGCGIPPHVRERIFEPFFTTKPLDKGTGLGLSTVRGIVKSHNGFMTVYSEIGIGTHFKVYLPAMDSSSVHLAQAQQSVLRMGHGELILVVDDEAAILNITQQCLETFGYEVLTAKDGAQAIALCALHRGKIKLMLTDMTMPIMDGAAAIQAARTIDPHIKIIAASGMGLEGGTAAPKLLNANAFLHKPYTAEHLLRVVAEVLESTSAAVD